MTMTIEELRVFVAALINLKNELQSKMADLDSYMETVADTVSENNPVSGIMDVDQYVTAQGVQYGWRLAAVQTALDNLVNGRT